MVDAEADSETSVDGTVDEDEAGAEGIAISTATRIRDGACFFSSSSVINICASPAPLPPALILAFDKLAAGNGEVCTGVGFNICIAREKITWRLGVRVVEAPEWGGSSSTVVEIRFGEVRFVDDARYAAEIGLIISHSLVCSVIQSGLRLFPPPCK